MKDDNEAVAGSGTGATECPPPPTHPASTPSHYVSNLHSMNRGEDAGAMVTVSTTKASIPHEVWYPPRVTFKFAR